MLILRSSRSNSESSTTAVEAAPLETANYQTHPAAFRFLDLPAEIRNQIYRYVLVRGQSVRIGKSYLKIRLRELAILFVNRLVYSEAMPVFLSYNNFIITGQRKELTWLRRMRPEGRRELRNVSLVLYRRAFNHDYSLFNALSLCSQMHLTLQTRTGLFAPAALESRGNLRNMHGFAAVTSNALPKKTDVCVRHQLEAATKWEVELKRERAKRVEDLLLQFQAPCVGRCRVHKGREETHTQATIHVYFSDTCYYCC